MRAIDCPCGHHLEGADDEELVRLAREHVEAHHPEMERSEEQLRARVALRPGNQKSSWLRPYWRSMRQVPAVGGALLLC